MNEIEIILTNSKTVAIVGVSPREDKPSNRVAKYLQAHGYDIIPVNPALSEVLGKTSYPDLLSVPGNIDVVDIFRRAEDVPEIVEQAIKIKARVIWMQEGVVNEDAARKAREAGFQVVMDLCMLKEHVKLRAKPQG